jgi:hypothetical protein
LHDLYDYPLPEHPVLLMIIFEKEG